MSKNRTINKITSPFKSTANFLSGMVKPKIFIVLSCVTFGFMMTLLSLKLGVKVTPSTSFGESIEGVVPLWYWLGIAIMIGAISYMMAHLDERNLRIPFLISCAMLVFSMRSVLAILSPFPIVQDTWGQIYRNEFWRKYGIFSQAGLEYFSQGYARGWPVSFILAYLITSAGIPVYAFYKWAPIIILILNLIVIYFLFKELANDKIGMVSAFLFTLLNTAGFFPLHYSPQTLGALFYLVAMYALVKAYKTRKLKHLGFALFSIFAVVLTHHMSTFFLGISLGGVYLSRYVLDLQKKMDVRNRWLSFTVKLDTFIKFSLPLSLFTFALWYFYGFIVYRFDATWMLTRIMQLLATRQPQYAAGYYERYLFLSPLMQFSILIFPAFILTTSVIFLLGRVLKKESLEGYLLFTTGWATALVLAFIFGNVVYGNFIEPVRALEIVAVALSPASALFLLRIFETKSPYKKGLITILLTIVAFFSVFSIYRAAQTIVYFEPPWWMSLFNPP